MVKFRAIRSVLKVGNLAILMVRKILQAKTQSYVANMKVCLVRLYQSVGLVYQDILITAADERFVATPVQLPLCLLLK